MKLQHCQACGRTQYPPRALCGSCLADRLVWQERAEVAGRLLAETMLHHSYEPRADLPLHVGLVRLECGDNAVVLLEGACAPGDLVMVRATPAGLLAAKPAGGLQSAAVAASGGPG